MIDTNVVKLATEYLDECQRKNSPATLVGMHWYIDGRNKTIPLTEEINEALAQRPSIRVHRINGRVFFVSDGTYRSITDEDMKQANKQYRKEFSAAYKELKDKE